MALNKYMHPRNIYKTPPDFGKLAKTYEDFSNIAKVDVNGKVSIDFKDPHALRILTKCLLKLDFNLDVIIPDDRLVPTLPLRLNYILWIEDLITTTTKNSRVLGLDIGTGACAIYPMLAAVKNKWQMLGTETNAESLKQAKDNIDRNNLQDLIEVRLNTTKTVIDCVFMDDNMQIYDFCMCNPPFYTNVQELWESRSPARPEPKNGFTGSPHELITEGGELQFCRQIIEESKKHPNDILIYTTMVGHKYNLRELIIDLKADGITYTTSEFCQGRVTRWGLAWTYQNYDLSKIFCPKDKARKKNVPIKFVVPELTDCRDPIEKLKIIFQELQVNYKVVTKRKNELTLDLTALSNTWSNQRRKRRLQKRFSEDQVKRSKYDSERISTDSFSQELHSSDKLNENRNRIEVITSKLEVTNDKISRKSLLTNQGEPDKININDSIVLKQPLTDNPLCSSLLENQEGANKLDEIEILEAKQNIFNEDTSCSSILKNQEGPNNLNKIVNRNHIEKPDLNYFKDKGSRNLLKNEGLVKLNENINVSSILPADQEVLSDNACHSDTLKSQEAVVHGIIKITQKEKLLNIDAEFVDGSAGKEGLHQIVQYIKNNWK